ncbi:MAG: hypothetical protein KA163_05980 [Bacteroidia bacterium]|nr:hypothetical protein [Bacteroidia bacterium]
MIAKVHIQLPYIVNIPEGEIFPLFHFQKDGYTICFYPLLRSEDADKYSSAEKVTMDEVIAYNADTLDIRFHKDSFERAATSEFDPPRKLITEVANDFLLRLRYVTGGYQIKPLNLSQSNFHITYLNDDETELEKKEGFIRGRGSKKIHISFIGVNNSVWKDVHKLSPFQSLPIWKTLLLDANAVLPEVGPAIVLTFTALEVFISKTLDEVATFNKTDKKLWKWINERGFYLKNPSLEEQFDFLSEHFVGKSIKEDVKLWQSFKNLQTARNSFAHSGVALVGGKEVDDVQALEFIRKAHEITEFIKIYLPNELKWVSFTNKIKFEAIMPIFKPLDKKDEQKDS